MNRKQYLLAALFSVSVIGGALFFTTKKSGGDVVAARYDIREYDPSIHKAFIKRQFSENWEWLTDDPKTDVDHVLDTRSPSRHEPKYHGKATIKVLHNEQGNPVGFGVYYMRHPLQGKILFIGVDQKHRGKRYAQTIVNHALQDLKSRGAKVVRLLTRKDNEKSQKVYDRMGFKRTHTDRYQHFSKDV